MELSLATAEHLRVPRLKSAPSPVISSDLPWDWTASSTSIRDIVCMFTTDWRFFVFGANQIKIILRESVQFSEDKCKSVG